jgi:hypothetical protein
MWIYSPVNMSVEKRIVNRIDVLIHLWTDGPMGFM